MLLYLLFKEDIMDSFVEKFNIFDLFTMLIPGIIISTLLGVSLSFKYHELWNSWGNEKYVIFFILSYLCGVIYQEIGSIVDSIFLSKILYGGKPKEIFLLKDKYEKILKNEILYNDAIQVKNYFLNILDMNNRRNMNIYQKRQLNSEIFSHCLSMSEKNNLTYKADKMLVISEMSRSLFWGCVTTIFLNIHLIFKYSFFYKFYYIEIVFLIILGLIFLHRKVRYEKYRFHILIRAFLLHIKIE